MSDKCTRCKRRREKGEHWYWIYPDVSSPKTLEPIAAYCPPCAAVEVPDHVAARKARRSKQKRRRVA